MATPEAAAIIPAAGKARRFGSGSNKIWSHVAGRTVLEWTLSAFDAHPAIASIVVVAGEDDAERIERVCAGKSKVVAVAEGGDSRAASVRNGLAKVPPSTNVVLVHDAARPLVTSELISRIIDCASRFGASIPGVAAPDTFKRVGSDGFVRITIPRSAEVGGTVCSGLTSVQTPQGARLELLQHAYACVDLSRTDVTDESFLLELAGIPVYVAQGDPDNIKITHAEDIGIADQLLSRRTDREPAASRETRTGFGYDVHTFATPDAGRPLFLGGVEIPHDRGLDGHSDADALLHAACDALLGAASLGDIGILFPNTDPAYRNIASIRLLEAVTLRVREAGWQIVNVDATVLAEAPKLMPHRERMQAAIARALQIEPSRVSIKATTSEGMGFVGRGEGIACWAVATLVSQ